MGEFLRKRLEAKLKDPTVIDRVQAEIDRAAADLITKSKAMRDGDYSSLAEKSRALKDQILVSRVGWRHAAPDPQLPFTPLNADGTIAIKGEAAEQLKALIREELEAHLEFKIPTVIHEL